MMSKDNDFFGDVFDSPEDDPLLGGEESDPLNESSSQSPNQGVPSWMSDEHTNGTAASDEDETTDDQREEAPQTPERKEIVVEGERDDSSLNELNEAVGQGWRLVRISLARPNGQQAASRREAKRFVAILEQDRPQSLFDFGG